LGQIIISPEFHPMAHTGVIGQAGHQYEGNRRRGRFITKGRKRQISVHLLHINVAKDQIRQHPSRNINPGGPILRLKNLKPFMRQRHMHHLAQPFLVIYYQDSLHVPTPSPTSPFDKTKGTTPRLCYPATSLLSKKRTWPWTINKRAATGMNGTPVRPY